MHTMHITLKANKSISDLDVSDIVNYKLVDDSVYPEGIYRTYKFIGAHDHLLDIKDYNDCWVFYAIFNNARLVNAGEA